MTGASTHPVRRSRATFAWLLFAALAGHAGAVARASGDSVAPTVRITSPLGRTGVAGTVRIVAQIGHDPAAPLRSVTFFVNKKAVGEDAQGPVYAVEWTDENPFEPTDIAVEAVDTAGREARDAITLAPFEYVETAHVSSVLLEATVQDAQGRYVEGISPEGFVLEENGVCQQLDVVRPETMPATYALVVDSSQSMSSRVQFLHDAAAHLATFLRPQDRMLVVPFSKTLGPITGPTDDGRTVAEAVSHIEPRGGTAIRNALIEVSRRLAGIEGRHVIVLVTDGYDEHSSVTYEETLDAVRSSASTVFVIGIGGVAGVSTDGERVLKRLANETGGRAFFPWRETQLPGVHDRIASDITKRYLITYTPTNQSSDGAWRAITLSASNPAYRVRTKPGYFAPKPPPVRPVLEFMVSGSERAELSVSRDDLRVVEGGVEQSIDTFYEATNPVSIVMVVDESGSMKNAAEAAKAAAKSFVEALRPEDSLGVILFADRAVLAQDLSTSRTGSLEALSTYQARGGTALYDAMHSALTRVERVEGRRVVVVFTDGRDENNAGTGPGSLVQLDDVMTQLRESGAIVFAIGLGAKVDRAVLERFAADSGGEAYFPEAVESLDDDYARIVENLRRRYAISYTSTNSTRDGGWRDVQITLRDPDARIIQRGGYFAPDK
jgi:VWFA-related protein